MAYRVAHLANLTVASFANRNRQSRVIRMRSRCYSPPDVAEQSDAGRDRLSAVDGYTLSEPVDVVHVWHAQDADLVHSGDLVTRVRQLCRQFAVVRQDE